MTSSRAITARHLTAHRAGPPTADPVLLIHPLGVDHRLWDLLADRLDAYHRVALDLPGHGLSPTPDDDYTILEVVDQVAGLMDSESLRGVHVIGMSLGGTVAQGLAGTRPDLVRSLVLADTVAKYPDAMHADWHRRAEVATTEGVGALLDELMPIWFTEEAIAAESPAIAYVRSAMLSTDPVGYARACRALASVDLTSHSAAIVAPTLVIHGDEDLPGVRAEAARMVAEMPDATLVVLSPGRHAALAESPDQFVRHVLSHLSRH